MNKHSLLRAALLATILTTKTLLAQDCKVPYSKDEAFTIKVSSYINNLTLNKKFLKASADKKHEMVEEYNSDILSGKTEGTTTYVKYEVTEFYDYGKGEYAVLTTNFGGKNYNSNVMCINDTLYSQRLDGIQWSVINGDTLGFSLAGVERIPVNLKVGDILPPYEDFIVSYPQTATVKGNYSVPMGVKKHSGVAYGNYKDSNTGSYKNGFHTYTYNVTQYVTKQADVQGVFEYKNYNKHYAIAAVTGKEPIEVDGEMMEAFIIDSETWYKTTVDGTYFSNNKAAQRDVETAEVKIEKLTNRKNHKWGLTNDEGFYVSPKKQWYVPGHGVVKTIGYDIFGHITAIF